MFQLWASLEDTARKPAPSSQSNDPLWLKNTCPKGRGKHRGMCLEATRDQGEQLKAGQGLLLLGPSSPQRRWSGLPQGPSSTYHLPVNRDIVASSQMPKQQVFELLEEGNIMKKLQRRNRQWQQKVRVQGQLAQESQLEKVPAGWCPSCSETPSLGGQEDVTSRSNSIQWLCHFKWNFYFLGVTF